MGLRELLMIRPYRWHVSGSSLGWAGFICRAVVLTVYVFEATGTAFGIALTLTLTVVPAVVIGPIMGMIVDRCDRRRCLIICYAAAGALIGSMAWPLAVEQVLIIAFLVGVCQSAINPANSGFITQIVPIRGVASAISVGTTLAHAVRVVVPVCVGTIILWYGLPAAFLFNAAIFFAAAVLMSRVVPVRSAEPVAAELRLADVWSGFRWVMRNPVLKVMVLLFVVGVLALDLPHLNTAVYLDKVLARPAAELGFVLSLIGGGAILGSIAAGKIRDNNRFTWFCLGMLISCAVLVPVGFGVGFVVLGLLWFVQGIGMGMLDVCAGTMFVHATPEQWRGRAVSATNAMVTSVMAVWYLIAGGITDAVGAAVVFGVVGGVCGVLVLAISLKTMGSVGKAIVKGA